MQIYYFTCNGCSYEPKLPLESSSLEQVLTDARCRVSPGPSTPFPFIPVTCILNVLGAFVFLNCDIGTEPTIINKMNGITGISEAVRVSGVYDIVARISEESEEKIVKLVKKIRGLSCIRSSLTMIIAGDSARPLAVAI